MELLGRLYLAGLGFNGMGWLAIVPPFHHHGLNFLRDASLSIYRVGRLSISVASVKYVAKS